MAEFAVVAGVFFMLIIGIIEFGRLLYTHNALTDAARRGARYAVLHPKNAACVKSVVVYGETHIDEAKCAPKGGASPLINGLSES
ncbi:MAG TPA: TadE family protein, partial [Pyrinomonadaceae bacterium]|nr:TadE family protein [Pyrinomonadaceae bacterium]